MYCQACGTFNDGDRKTYRGCGRPLGLTLASAVLLLLTLKAFALLLSLGAMVLILFSLRKRFDTGTVLLFVFTFICCMTACVHVFDS